MGVSAGVVGVGTSPSQPMKPRPQHAGFAAHELAWLRDRLQGATGKGVRIAVIDSGWDRSILDARVLPGRSFVGAGEDLVEMPSEDDHDRLGHGTECAALILEVAPEAEIVPVRLFGSRLEAFATRLKAALDWCADQGFHVINISLGTHDRAVAGALYRSCEDARRAGAVIVAAGSRSFSQGWSYPAIFDNVIGVDASMRLPAHAYRYRRGHPMEVEAWGIARPVSSLGGRISVRSGSSFAAPSVAGSVALVLERHPTASLDDVRHWLHWYASS